MTVAFLHADPFVPRCQQVVARHALGRASLQPTLTTTLAPSPALGVARWIGQALMAKLEAVRAGGLYVDARLLITGDLRGLLEERTAVGDSRSLRYARLLWIPGPGIAAPRAVRDYDAIVDEELSGLMPLPEAWQPTTFRGRPDARVIDVTPREERPWVSPSAPCGVPWFGRLRDALDRGDLASEALRLDVRDGLLRPSLLIQLERGVQDARRLPADLLAQDASFPFAELSASAEQRGLVTSPAFVERMRELRRSNRRLAKGVKQPPRGGTMVRLLGLLRRARGAGDTQ